MKNLITPLSLSLILIASGCSTLKVERNEVKKIKKAAIVGFSVEQTQPNTAEGVVKSLFSVSNEAPGGMSAVPAEIATPAPHVNQMYQDLSSELQKNLDWKVADRKALEQQPAFVNFRAAKTKQPQMRPMVQNKNVRIHVPEGGIETFLLNSTDHEERRKLMQAMGVDAIILAHVRVELEDSGGIKKVVGAGDFNSKATLSFRVFTADQEDPIWLDSYAAGETTKESAEHALGFANVDALNKQAIIATRSAYKALIDRYKNP